LGIWFKQDQKNNSLNYKYKVVGIFLTREHAIMREIRLHDKFSVGKNLNFYNQSKQTCIGFDTTGRVSVLDNNGAAFPLV
jgi:hypothetical protein